MIRSENRSALVQSNFTHKFLCWWSTIVFLLLNQLKIWKETKSMRKRTIDKRDSAHSKWWTNSRTFSFSCPHTHLIALICFEFLSVCLGVYVSCEYKQTTLIGQAGNSNFFSFTTGRRKTEESIKSVHTNLKFLFSTCPDIFMNTSTSSTHNRYSKWQ